MRVAVLIAGATRGLQPVKSAALLQALGAELGTVTPWDVALTRRDRLLVGLATLSPTLLRDRARMRARFNASPAAFLARSRAAARLAAGAETPPDAVLQLGVTFDAAAVAARWPLVIYTDWTVALTQDHGREWRLDLPEADIAARLALERAALDRAALICTRSHLVADALRDRQHVPPDRLRVVGGGPNIAAEGPRADLPRLLFFGREFHRKGGDTLLAALALLRRDWPWLQTDIIGAPPPGPPSPSGIQWHPDPPVAEVARLLGRAAILPMPSRFETWGDALVEAMAAGVVPVIPALPPLTEIVTDGLDGLVVPPGDPAALAGAIARLLADPALRARLSRAAAARIAADLTQGAVAARIGRALALAAAARQGAARDRVPGGGPAPLQNGQRGDQGD